MELPYNAVNLKDYSVNSRKKNMDRFKILLKISLFIAVTLVITGCENKNKTIVTTPTISKTKITIYQLASALGMRVTNTNSTYVTLQDSKNTVLVFTYSDGNYYINGREQGKVGSVTKDNGSILVSEDLVGKIKSKMTQAAPMPSVSTTPTLPRTYAKVMLDPGHGGKDPGAIAKTGVYEKVLNLQVAQKVAYQLRQWGVTVVMTRQNDVKIELEDRVAMANRYNPDLFVSIHADTCEDSAITGYSVYASRTASSESINAANKIVSAMKGTGFVDRGVKRADFKVIAQTKCPAVLIEMGYLSNRFQATLLAQNETQQKIAYSIARGIYDAVK